METSQWAKVPLSSLFGDKDAKDVFYIILLLVLPSVAAQDIGLSPPHIDLDTSLSSSFSLINPSGSPLLFTVEHSENLEFISLPSSIPASGRIKLLFIAKKPKQEVIKIRFSDSLIIIPEIELPIRSIARPFPWLEIILFSLVAVVAIAGYVFSTVAYSDTL